MTEGYPDFFTPEQIEALETKVVENVPSTEHKIEHKWLYSVVPVSGVPFPVWDSEGAFRNTLPMIAALVGYCKNCGRAFSKIVPTQEEYKEYPMDVERYGCVVPY